MGGQLMNLRSRRKGSNDWSEGSKEIPVYVALVLIAIGAIGLAYLALSGVHLGAQPTIAPVPDSTPTAVLSPTPTPTSTPTVSPEQASVAVGFLSGESASWWSASVEAGLIPGVTPGPRVASDDLTIAEVTSEVDQVVASDGQPVVIQVGTQDIVEGASAAEIDASIKSLWQEVIDRGGRPIAALIPPSNSFPGSVVTVNNQIRASALANGIAVLDVTTPVAAVDGTWAAGLSDDGQQPNSLGTAAIVAAVAGQLPALLGIAPLVG